jgi:hypothetical protein
MEKETSGTSNKLLKDLFAHKKWKKKLVVHQTDVLKSEQQTTNEKSSNHLVKCSTR